MVAVTPRRPCPSRDAGATGHNARALDAGDRVFVTQSIGTRRSLLCFHRANGRELWSTGIDVLPPERRWRDAPYCAPSPVTEVCAAGLADCLDLRTGQVIWAERLRGDGGNTLLWSSPLLVGDRLYVSNLSGDTFVIRAAPRFELIAVNSLGEEINAPTRRQSAPSVIRQQIGKLLPSGHGKA